MNKPVEIKEFDSIISNKDYADVENYTSIAQKDFEDLKTFIEKYAGTEENADALDFMRIGFKRNVGYTVTFKSYVGLIQMKTGFQIQVLPKIGFQVSNFKFSFYVAILKINSSDGGRDSGLTIIQITIILIRQISVN